MSATTTTETKPNAPGFRQVLSNRNYRNLLIAQFVSDLGDGVYSLGLMWAMKQLTGSAVQMSMVLIAGLLPTLVLGIFAGVFVDRGSKKRFMIQADLFRGLVVALLAFLWWSGEIRPWMLVAAAAVLSSFSAFFTPARTVSVRTLVDKEGMMQAQSLSQTTNTIVGLGAPALAAVLVSFDIALTFAFNALSYFLSLLFIMMIRDERLIAKKEEKSNFAGLKTSLREGFRTILTVAILRNLLVYAVLLNFMFAPIAVLFPMYADTAVQLATYETLFFAGLLAGSVGTGFMGKLPKVIPICCGILLVLIGFGALALTYQFPVALVCVFCAGFGLPMTNITLNSLFSIKVPLEMLGRASSTMNVLVQSAKPISLSMSASLLIMFSVRELLLYISLFALLIVVAMVLNPVIRRVEE